MLESNIPDDVEARVEEILVERYPNFCDECGSEIVLAGGWQRLTPGKGLWYDHVDVVLTCSRDDCDRPKRIHMSGLDQLEGQAYYRDAPRVYREEFAGVRFYCEHHGDEYVTVTKDIEGSDGRPLRQWKCGECDRGTAMVAVDVDDQD